MTVDNASNSSTSARTDAMPFPTTFTSPAASTVTTDSSPDVHLMVTPEMVRPSRSCTVAVSRMVSSNQRSVAESGEIAMLAGTGGSVPHPPAKARTTSQNTH